MQLDGRGFKPEFQCLFGVGDGFGFGISGRSTAGQFREDRRPAIGFRVEFNQKTQFHAGNLTAFVQRGKREPICPSRPPRLIFLFEQSFLRCSLNPHKERFIQSKP